MVLILVKHASDLDERACTAIKNALSEWKQPREGDQFF